MSSRKENPQSGRLLAEIPSSSKPVPGLALLTSLQPLMLCGLLFRGLPEEPLLPQAPPRDLPGLHHFRKVADCTYIGGEPEGEAAFASLQKLGVAVIVSVDGAIPDVAAAEKYGIRYIHIPIGYDGIPEDAAMALTRVAREVNVPVYVHCHHGKHRGPAAAAVLCLADGRLNPDQAIALMKQAGTDKDYTGLWRDVKHFIPPGRNVRLPDLVSVARVESLPAAMAKIDRSFDHLKLCAAAGWKSPDDHPEISPSAEALLIQETLHECGRDLKSDYHAQFQVWLRESEDTAAELRNQILNGDPTASQTLCHLETKCGQCHAAFRN